MNTLNKHLFINYIFIFLMVVLFATSCEKDADDYVWEQRTTYQVGNCNNLVNLRKEPTTKSAIVAKLSKGTKLTVVEIEDDEWSKVQTSEGSCGYLSSQFIVETTGQYKVREKTDRDDLEYANQMITLSLIDIYNSQKRTGDLIWLVVVCSVLALICGVAGYESFEDSFSDALYVVLNRRYFSVKLLVKYLLILVNGVGLFYVALFFDHQTWDLNLIVGLLLIAGFFIGVTALWLALVGVTSELLHGSKYVIYHVLGNLATIVIALICGYWIEGLTDFVILMGIIMNVVFLILYLIEANNKDIILKGLAVIPLWIVCFIPTMIFTVLAVQILLAIIFVLLVLSLFAMGGGGSRSGSRQVSDQGRYNRSVLDEYGREIDRIDKDGYSEYGGRKYVKRSGDDKYEREF